MADPLSRLTTAVSDRYRIERELGAGGMATVYLAEDLRHTRKVAIKVLRPELAAVIGAERFLREIKTIANLQHPHILGLIDSGEVHGTAYYVMPFVEGESLRDRLTREKQLPIADAVRLATQVAGALDYAHRHGVIHRDIKPENVMLHDGSALVADFGIALAVSSAGGGSRMTETGMSLGTPHYMSPGAGDGRAGDHRTERRVRARGHDLRDAGGRAAVHRSHGAGDRGQGDDGGAGRPHRPAPERSCRRRGCGADGARQAAGRPLRHRGGVLRGPGDTRRLPPGGRPRSERAGPGGAADPGGSPRR